MSFDFDMMYFSELCSLSDNNIVCVCGVGGEGRGNFLLCKNLLVATCLEFAKFTSHITIHFVL